MMKIREKVSRFLKSEDGPTAVEYAVMVALIIVVAIGAVTFLGQSVSGQLSNVATKVAVPS
ncbi:MAG: Flp family type IVb pilin [Gemmataceae bacterium]|nr:Flp family type IVb pilin [Gemmataceae bacterium]